MPIVGFYQDEIAVLGRLSQEDGLVMEKILKWFLTKGNDIGLNGVRVQEGGHSLGLIDGQLRYKFGTEPEVPQ